MATVIRDRLAPKYSHDPEDIDTEVIGRRVGETLHEEIMSEREGERAMEGKNIYAIPPDTEGTDTYDTAISTS